MTGRNALCPCGSKRKYKQCCYLNKYREKDAADLVRQQLNRQSSDIIKRVMQYAKPHIDPDFIAELQSAFVCGHDELLDSNARVIAEKEGFWHWFYFKALLGTENDEAEGSLASYYLNEKGYQLTVHARNYAHAICKAYYSFYEIVNLTPGHSVTVKDLLLDKTLFVHEESGSTQMKPGQVFFSTIVPFDNINTFSGLFNAPLPNDCHVDMLDLREAINNAFDSPLTEELMPNPELQEMLREYCMSLYYKAYHGPSPKIVNKEGQPFEFNTVEYDVLSNKTDIINKLVDILPPGETPASILALEKSGSVNFPWVEKTSADSWGHSVLADVRINDTTLTLSANSTNRSTKLEILLEDYLQDDIKKRSHHRESIEEAAQRHRRYGNKKKEINTETSFKANSAQKDYIKHYYKKWLDMPIPLLNDATPREAAADIALRPRLEALLNDFEAKANNSDLEGPDVALLRKTLGIP